MKVSQLSNWIQKLLSANLPDDHPEVIEVRQVRTLNFIILLVIFMALPLPLHYYFIGVQWMVVAISAAILFALFIVVHLWRTHNYVLCGHLAILDFLWLILFSNFITGGFYDSNFAVFYTVPVLAAFIAGIRGVFIYTGVTLLITLGFFMLDKVGIEIPNVIQEESRNSQALINRLFALTMLAAISIGFLFHRNFAEKLLQQSKVREQELHQSKSRFFASMSHEIRTPMNSVLGLTEMLQLSDLNQEQEKYVRTILRSGNTLMTVINDILDYSLIESGKLSVANKPFDLRDLLNDLVETFNNPTNSMVEFRVDIADAVPQFVSGDSVRLYQVISNLLNNAFKFTEQGFVKLSVDAEDRAEQWDLSFVIKDTGIGIAEEGKLELFEAFHRVMPQGDKIYGGTGLGLNICKYLVDLMGGSIGFDSKEGYGTSMFFNIPFDSAVPPEQIQVNSEKDKKSHHYDHIKVLVAEDNVANQMVVAAFLKKLGVDFDLCENGRQVLDLLKTTNSSYDLLLLDCEMPLLDGFDTAKEIRTFEKQHYKEAIFICAFTAHVVDEVIERCYSSGMDTYIAKPLDMKSLVNVLNLTLKYKDR